MKDLFRKAGHVVRADVAMGPDSRSRGFGTVIFLHEDEAKKAIGMECTSGLMIFLMFVSLDADSIQMSINCPFISGCCY